MDINKNYIDVVFIINEVNKKINLSSSSILNFDLHKHIIFSHYPYFIRCSRTWFFEDIYLNTFIESMQQKINNYKYFSDELKIDICLELNNMKLFIPNPNPNPKPDYFIY